MKLLCIVNDLSGTHGWSTYARNIITEAQRGGNEVYVAVEKEYIIPGMSINQFPILMHPHKLLWNPLHIFRQSKKLRDLIAKLRPDVIHVIAEPYIQPFAISKIDTPIVLTIHGTYAIMPQLLKKGIKRSISYFFYNRALKNVANLIAVSERTKQSFLKFGPSYPKKMIHVVHNSIEIPEILSIHKKSSIPPYHVVTVGAVKQRKGIHIAIRLFANWANIHKKHVQYDVVGSLNESLEYVTDVRDLAESLKSKYFSTHFHGQVSSKDKSAILEMASLYVHLEDMSEESFNVEGFGIGIIEAASYGLPALVAKGSATAEAVQDGLTGYVVDLHNKSAIQESVDSLLIQGTIKQSDLLSWARLHSPKTIFQAIQSIYTASQHEMDTSTH